MAVRIEIVGPGPKPLITSVTALVAVRIEIQRGHNRFQNDHVTALVAVRIEISVNGRIFDVVRSHRPCGGED